MIVAPDHVHESVDQTPTPLRLPAATGMARAALVLCTPERRLADGMSILAGDQGVSDARVAAFFAELLALGGMAVIA